KTNDLGGGNAVVNAPFNWTITIANNGSVAATYTNDTVLTDDLPTSGATYGSPTCVPGAGASGTCTCSISSNTLTCTSGGGSNALVVSAGGTVTITVQVTPTTAGTLTNPRSAGTCAVVDPPGVGDSDPANNNCSDAVVVVAPTPTQTPTHTPT